MMNAILILAEGKMIRTFGLGTTLLACTVASVSWSAEVFAVNDSRCDAVLTGDIQPADTQRVAEVLPGYGTICLDSAGGNYREGRMLFDFFMVNGIATYVTSSSQCQSACALALLGGSAWGDFRHSVKTIEPGALVAFHAPYLVLAEGQYSNEDMSEAVGGAIEIAADLVSQRRSLMISEHLLSNFLLFNSRSTKPVLTVGDAAHGGFAIQAPPNEIKQDFASRVAACRVLFDVFGSDFDIKQVAWEPHFPAGESEFSKIVDLGQVAFDGNKWAAVGVDNDWETPWLGSGCAFSTEGARGTEDWQEVLMWVTEKTGDCGGPEKATQVMRRSAAW